MPLISDVISAPEGVGLLSEADFRTTCPTCGIQQRLSRAIVDASDPWETVYLCKNGCVGPMLIVTTPGVVSWEGRGYRIGDWVVRNPRDLFITTIGNDVLMPASPNALE